MNAKNTLLSAQVWIRIVFVIIFAVVFSIAQYLAFLVALFQAIISLFCEKPNVQLQHFGAGLADYCKQLTRYLSYNTTTKPFPFSDWPKSEAPDSNAALKPAQSARPARQAPKAATTKAKAAPKSSSAKSSASTSKVKKASTSSTKKAKPTKQAADKSTPPSTNA